MPAGGGYRYYRDERARPGVRARRWTRCSTTYAEALPRVRAWVDEHVPAARTASRRRRTRRAVKAKALDLLRGLLPAASLSHMGIYAHAARPTSS